VQLSTPYLKIDASKLHVPPLPEYAAALDQLGTKARVPEPKHLETLVEQVRQLCEAITDEEREGARKNRP
jgi:hypothetical protein